MCSKLETLKELRKKFDIEINGLENYSINVPNLIIANHNCLMDIFFLPMSLPTDIISLISARLIYKKNMERQQMIEKYLYAMPIEAHGGKKYADMCINNASTLLNKGYNLSIFPEGAYIEEDAIYRGRTGATRILYNSRTQGVIANLVPVAIDIDKRNLNLDSYSLDGNKIKITILPPIDYTNYYKKYLASNNLDERKEMLHKPVDIGLSLIASTLNKKYYNEYIELYPKKNIILENGEIIPVDEAQTNQYLSLYSSQLEKRKEKILKRICSNNEIN
ncbi:MAG: 1-acyl-sn-glycerol-3-phosphate acyltransferase [Bacilli bacterium]|nr:1-acyl-sn-glycerol-3-phosphate acyltransferase [Bacilli bacterium]